MNSASSRQFFSHVPDYRSMPVNLVTAFESGDIAYNLMASLYQDGTGNQVLDGTSPLSNRTQHLIDSRDLPAFVNPKNGFFVAANNQASIGAKPIPGTVRFQHLNMRLGSLT